MQATQAIHQRKKKGTLDRSIKFLCRLKMTNHKIDTHFIFACQHVETPELLISNR